MKFLVKTFIIYLLLQKYTSIKSLYFKIQQDLRNDILKIFYDFARRFRRKKLKVLNFNEFTDRKTIIEKNVELYLNFNLL